MSTTFSKISFRYALFESDLYNITLGCYFSQGFLQLFVFFRYNFDKHTFSDPFFFSFCKLTRTRHIDKNEWFALFFRLAEGVYNASDLQL